MTNDECLISDGEWPAIEQDKKIAVMEPDTITFPVVGSPASFHCHSAANIIFFFILMLALNGCENQSGRSRQELDLKKIKNAIAVSRHFADSNSVKSALSATEAISLARKANDTIHFCEGSLLLASAFIRQKKYGEAQKIIAETLPVTQRAGLKEDQCRALYLEGLLETKKLEFKNALVYYDSAFKLIKEFDWKGQEDKRRYDLTVAVMSGIGTVSSRLGLIRQAISTMSGNLTPGNPEELRMYSLGHLAELYRMAGSYDTARQYLTEAIVIANRINRPGYLIKMLGLKANVFFNLGKYDSCLFYNHKAEIITISGRAEMKDLPYIYNNLASAYQKTSNLPKAVVYFSKSLKLKEESRDSAGIATTMSNLGIIYENWGDRQRALDYFHKALAINLKLKNQNGIAKGYINMGEFFFTGLQYDSAIVYFTKALEIRRELSDIYGCIIALDGLGRSWRNHPAHSGRAMVYFSEAELLAEKIDAEYWIASLNYEIGDLGRRSGNYRLARERFRKSVEYARQEKQYDILMDATRGALEATLREKRQLDVLQLFTDYTAMSDTIRKREKDEITAEMLVKYETEKREQENLLLKKEVGYQDLLLRSRTIQLIGLLLMVMILGIFGAVTYWLYRKKAAAYRIIIEQNIAAVKNETRPEKGVGPMNILDPEIFSTIEASDRDLLNRLFDYMEKEKPYLKHDLSLDDLCKTLNTNRSYLSGIINTAMGRNFHHFINEYRVAEARRILTGIKGNLYSVEDIGRMSGFGTKSSFYTCFKSAIGVTPAYFRDFVVKTLQ
jgi:tetratricopeptide (TPR) repeat protein